MKRRLFFKYSSFIALGLSISPELKAFGKFTEKLSDLNDAESYFSLFLDPTMQYRPFVRWWWNGNKVEKSELIRELRLLKDNGIGGVEINPIGMPINDGDGDKRSLMWLSDEWIEMLKVTFDEAKLLNMTCDLIVGSGWPFGSESLPLEDRAEVMILYAEKVPSSVTYSVSKFHIITSVDPGVTVTNSERTGEIVDLRLVREPICSLEDSIDLSDKCGDDVITVDVPEGDYYLYALVNYKSFACVINGAPGASGHILNHMDEGAVYRYLKNMSDTIEAKIGPLKNHIRAMFTDSMELEGNNWNRDLAEEFERRRGYKLMPWLPYIMFKVGRLGEVTNYNYGASKSDSFRDRVNRVRFDFELTKAELYFERFTQTYLTWCRELGVKSRAQAYGRGFFPLESSLGYDIPEGESWTTNWLQHRLGEEMGDEDYRRGRGYTMINKYVSSAANLTGKRVVSSEEMTNTYRVFSATPELLKIGSDMGAFSGTTQTIWSGFNYSPQDVPFPGWMRYGSFYSEQCTWWPFFKELNRYRARISSQLQNADMCTNIALLPANYDLWSELGVQTDPFPWYLNVDYTSLIWEAIHKNGGGADYVTEIIIGNSVVRSGKLCYGEKRYDTLILIEVSSIGEETLSRICDFVSTGGKVFCIGKYPYKSLGYKDYERRDAEVSAMVEGLKRDFPDRFVMLDKPEDRRYLEWYKDIIELYDMPRYIQVDNPDRFLLINKYVREDNRDIFLISNVHMHERRATNIHFPKSLLGGHKAWVWSPTDGNRGLLKLTGDSAYIDLGPAETILIVFDKRSKGREWIPLANTSDNAIYIDKWEVNLVHIREKWNKLLSLRSLVDFKNTEYRDFAGDIHYRAVLNLEDRERHILNLGKVWCVNTLRVNGIDYPGKWYGDRIYDISDALRIGENIIEVTVSTTMSNYMKGLKSSPTAQHYTMRPGKEQPFTSLGMIGPVMLY